ncbi:hypothetical protein A9Q79_00995 [Methylophaga sp. 42_25_T18]|nr:hypothetical protein A9Q79_00995 [Methylophaga sp. 42_25_T18]OUR85887.1 hypothetical protein A9Q92_07190 [Methylophaga sp. 42_8_T64]
MSFELPDNMPNLNLSVPADRESIAGIELNESLLHHWIRQLPKNDLLAYNEIYLEALKRFNRNTLDGKERLLLLDLYRKPLNSLLFSLTIPKLADTIADASQRLQVITDLTELMNELAMGYKIIINDTSEHSSNLKLNLIAQLAINRACEQLSYQALHAYKFYQTVPVRVFKELHQLYQLSLHTNIADITPILGKQTKALFSLHQRYAQILLVSICNPYGLSSGNVLEAYFMMEQLIDDVELLPFPENHQATAGHFFINCLSDRTPTPTLLPVMEDQAQPPTLILNTKPLLIIADILFQQSNKGQISDGTINIDLFKQLIPFLNTSYQRKQIRIPVTGNEQVFLAFGLASIHHCLSNIDKLTDADYESYKSPWDILNKNTYGYLVNKQHVENCHDLKIGDFVGVFERQTTNKPVVAKLASIRWLRTDPNNFTKTGLETFAGEPIAVQFSLDSSEQTHPALLLPEMGHRNQAASLITAPGIYSSQQTLRIKTKKKHLNFTVDVDQLLESNTNFERFTFTDKFD